MNDQITYDHKLRNLEDEPVDLEEGQRVQILHSWIERKPDNDDGQHYEIVHVVGVDSSAE
jgi:hypothetical protein